MPQLRPTVAKIGGKKKKIYIQTHTHTHTHIYIYRRKVTFY